MLPNHYENNAGEERKREFRRQQDRLKMMTPDTDRKTVSADAMIDSLLQKSDTFRKVSSDLPPWLQIDSPLRCPYYEKIWEVVHLSDKFVDTGRISQVLLTSGLHPDVLGYIWNLANKTTPGQLTKQELYIVLALVGLAQSGCTFSTVAVLNMVSSPPLPRLHIPFQSAFTRPPTAVISPTIPAVPVLPPQQIPSIQPLGVPLKSPLDTPRLVIGLADGLTHIGSLAQNPTPHFAADDEFQDFQSVHSDPTPALGFPNTASVVSPSPKEFTASLSLSSTNIKPENVTPKTPYLTEEPKQLSTPNLMAPTMETSKVCEPPVVSSSLATELATASDSDLHSTDDFADFQSADPFDTSIVQPAKISLPKLSSFRKVSPESERKLRQLSQPESLTALPESKISSRNQVSSMPSIAVLCASRSVGSRLANHSLAGAKSDKVKLHQKHLKLKPTASVGSSAMPVEDIFPKCLTKPSTFLLKETKIPSSDMDPDLDGTVEHELTRRIEIPSIGTFKETTLPVGNNKSPLVEKKSEEPAKSKTGDPLLSMEEDRYGALRELELFNEEPVLREVSEDFGEFLSADLPSEKAVEAWNTWNSSVNVPETAFEETPLKTLLDDSFDVGLANIEIPSDVSLAQPPTATTVAAEPITNVSSGVDLLGDSFDLPFATLNVSAAIREHDLASNLNAGLSENVASNSTDKILVADDGFNDFGDFVTPSLETLDAVVPTSKLPPLEDTGSIHSSTPSFDLSLTRHDSWSSLEFPAEKDLGGKPSRKSSEPSLDLPVEAEADPLQVTSRCLQCCHALLKEAVHIFNGVSDRSILREVFETQQAQNYLKYLGIVYYIARRISLNGGGSHGLYNDISTFWQQLQTLALDFAIPLSDAETETGSGTRPCPVCKGITTESDIEQDGTRYHATCANLWVNCIEVSLPCVLGKQISSST